MKIAYFPFLQIGEGLRGRCMRKPMRSHFPEADGLRLSRNWSGYRFRIRRSMPTLLLWLWPGNYKKNDFLLSQISKFRSKAHANAGMHTATTTSNPLRADPFGVLVLNVLVVSAAIVTGFAQMMRNRALPATECQLFSSQSSSLSF